MKGLPVSALNTLQRIALATPMANRGLRVGTRDVEGPDGHLTQVGAPGIRSLERRGLVERFPGPGARQVVVTPAGAEVLAIPEGLVEP